MRLPVLLLLATAVLGACAEPAPRAVSLEHLTAEADQHDGRRVLTSGVVREFDETQALARHFVLEDAAQNRVELLPPEAAEPYVDQAVSVLGHFTFDEDTGRSIDVDAIEPVD